jgi:hypothetical protein
LIKLDKYYINNLYSFHKNEAKSYSKSNKFYPLNISKLLVFIILPFVLFISCSQHSKNDFTKRPLKILFIGNSLTQYNGGLDYILRKMFARTQPKMLIHSEKVAPGGEHLAGHFNKGKALKKIKETEWDIVVIQEYSNGPIINKEDFHKYSRLFVKEIRRKGANAIFYMTFGYKNNPDMLPLISNSYNSVAKDLKCEVVPVGRAWHKVLDERKDIEMYSDFKHPNKNGTYLASCVFYSFLTGKHPSASTFTDGIAPEVATYLQNTAWETVTNWKSNYAK